MHHISAARRRHLLHVDSTNKGQRNVYTHSPFISEEEIYTLEASLQYSVSLAVTLVVYFKALYSDCPMLCDVLTPYVNLSRPVDARLLRHQIMTDIAYIFKFHTFHLMWF